MNGEEKNSIEKVENLIKRCDECKLKECINCETNYTEITSIKRIVDSYKRLLKEDETLKKEKEQAWEEWNNLEQGSYETEQKLKQQIKELQKENEELKNNGVIDENGFEFAVDCDWDRLKRLIDTADKSEEFILYNNEKWIKEKYCIPIQKVKNIIDRIDYDIKKTKEIISNDPKNNYQITRLKAMNTKSLDIKKRLQELLESEE